jgi:hypothetical protein
MATKATKKDETLDPTVAAYLNNKFGVKEDIAPAAPVPPSVTFPPVGQFQIATPQEQAPNPPGYTPPAIATGPTAPFMQGPAANWMTGDVVNKDTRATGPLPGPTTSTGLTQVTDVAGPQSGAKITYPNEAPAAPFTGKVESAPAAAPKAAPVAKPATPAAKPADKPMDFSGLWDVLRAVGYSAADVIKGADNKEAISKIGSEVTFRFNEDPTSPTSRAMQKYAMKLVGGKDMSKYSANQLVSMIPSLEGAYKITSDEAANQMANAIAMAKAQGAGAADVEKEVNELTKKVGTGDTIELISSIGNMENIIGYDLDNVDVEGNINGKGAEIPGLILPGANPFGGFKALFNQPDKIASYNRSVKNIQDILGRMRSGGQIGDKELVTFTEILGQTSMSPKQRAIELAKFKKMVTARLKNAYAGYSPEAVAEYESRTGNPTKAGQEYAATGRMAGGSSAPAPQVNKVWYTNPANGQRFGIDANDKGAIADAEADGLVKFQ